MAKHIAFFVSSLNLGGVERAFVTLANNFIEEGHQVDFIVCQYIGELRDELNHKIKIIDFEGSRLRSCFFKLYKYIIKASVDCIITGPTYPNIIALLCNLMCFKKLKIIISQHSYQDIEMNNLGIIGKVAPFLIRNTYNQAEKIIAVSDGVRNDLIENYNVKSGKIKTIYNAVLDNSFFSKSQEEIAPTIAKILSLKPYLIAVGRLELVKNYSFMLNAFAVMKTTIPDFNYNLIILGSGSEMDNLKNEIRQLGIQDSVYLLGAISNPLPIIKGAKVFIHTSLSEAMGLVYVEALALKVPVITIYNEGAKEVLKDVVPKIIIPTHNQQDFINGILSIMDIDFTGEFPDLKQYYSDKIRDSYLALI